MQQWTAAFMLMASASILVSCDIQQSDDLETRIERIETGILPAVVIDGEAPPRETIGDIMRRFSVPGVSVAVINDGAIEWAKGYGTIELGGTPVNTETLFLAGHISQAAAAVGALKLVQAGSLDLDETVNGRLRSWQIPDDQRDAAINVTLRQLLNHTSGLGVRSLLGYLTTETVPTIREILDGAAPAKNDPIRLSAEPGVGLEYSLGAYVVLQQLMEDVTGSSYSDFIDSTVLGPLGMERSFHTQPLTENLAANAAHGHEPTNEQVEGRWRTYPELAALGMWSTPSDLARLAVALQKANAGEPHSILQQRLAAEMVSQQNENRGLGVEIGGSEDWRFFRLEGHGNNYLTDLFAYVTKGMGAVVMTNSSNGEAVKAHILRAIASEYNWPDLLPERVTAGVLPDAVLHDLPGTYSFRGRDRIVSVDGDRIVQSAEGSPDQELRALSDSVLVSITYGYRYGVDRDEDGSITGLTLMLNGQRLFTYEKTE